MAAYSLEEHYYLLDNMLLSSCQQIRHIFKNRFKLETGKDWMDDPESLEKFANGYGQYAFRKAQYFQKTLMKSEPLEVWDISLLAIVIQNFGDEGKYQQENFAVVALKDMRNYLAHHPTKKIRKEEYYEKVKALHANLKILGLKDDDINNLTKRSEATSSLKAFQYVQSLFVKADTLVKQGNVDEAARCYNEAVEVPHLLPANLTVVYEKRAEFMLSLVSNPAKGREKVEQAFQDVKKALELNDLSWKGHYLMAKCFRLKHNVSTAIEHFERSLAISPSQKEVKVEMEACKVLAGVHSRRDHLIPSLMPQTVGDCVKDFEARFGVKMTEDELVKRYFGKKKDGSGSRKQPGFDHFYRGFRHYNGLGVPLDFTEAVKCYSKAARAKHPEAMYYLATCYLNGHGTSQNVQEAMRLYNEVAEMDPKSPGTTTQMFCNEGVALAQHALGLAYETGCGVDTNFDLAAVWYQRGMNNGVGASAYNLGNLYSNGRGVPQDQKMAAMCWKEGVNLKAVPAAVQLVQYYMREIEPDKALHYFKTGNQIGGEALLGISEEEFCRHVDEAKKKRQEFEPKLKEFEKSLKLEIEGLTFNERITRMLQWSSPQLAQLKAIYDKGETASAYRMTAGNDYSLTAEMLQQIAHRAMQGSETAQRVLETLTFNGELAGLLSQHNEFSEAKKLEVLDQAYKCVVRDVHLVRLEDTSKLKRILSSLLDDEKYGRKGDVDMKTRLCFALINLGAAAMASQDMYAVELLKEGVRRYPDNVTYYKYLAVLHASKKMFDLSKFYVEEGLKVDPDNLELLWFHATWLCKKAYKGKSQGEGLEVLEKFISLAPSDHQMLPEALYLACYTHLFEVENCSASGTTVASKDKNMKLAKSFFSRAQLAEKHQLPCYSNGKASEVKILMEMAMLGLDNESAEDVVSGKKKEKTTAKGRAAKPSTTETNENSVLDQRPYLKAPTRRNVLKLHRETLKEMVEQTSLVKGDHAIVISTVPPKLKQTVAKTMSLVTPITIQEMNPMIDHIYNNRIIDLTIIDEPNHYLGAIACVAEDTNGDVIRVQVYNVKKTKENLQKLAPGCKIAIVNPYLRIGLHHQVVCLRNDEPKCIIYMEKLENMCRFCGKENALQKCAKCMRPYCNKECQTLDWREMGHKLICRLQAY